MSMQLSWCRSLQGDAFPAAAFQQLLGEIEYATPFNRLAWLRGAELGLPPEQTLHVLMGWKKQRLVLCLPLIYCREKKAGLPLRVVRHLGFPLSDRLALMVADNATEFMALALNVISQQLPHAVLQINELIDATRVLSTWHQACWYSTCTVSCRAPEHKIIEADRQEASDKTLRYELRRAKKRCAEIDARVIRVSPDRETIDTLLDFIRAVEQASWKGADGLGIFSGAQRQRWMHEALRGLAEDGCVRVVLLEHQGRCISYRLGLLEHGRLYDYNIAFLPDYANLGSGRLLLDEWIRWGLDENWQWIDASRISLSRSSHQLHERMSGQVEHQCRSFYSTSPSGLLLGLADRVWKKLKPALKKRYKR